MLSSDQNKGFGMTETYAKRRRGAAGMKLGLLLAATIGLASCQPLYGTGDVKGNAGSVYDPLPGGSIGIEPVDDRVSQQVRNQLLFLMQGGISPADPRYDMTLTVVSITREIAPSTEGRDNSSGNVQVIVDYVVRDTKNGNKEVSEGKRQAQASFDRTGQSFANYRAERDAQNRAARAVAEVVRLAVLGDLSKE